MRLLSLGLLIFFLLLFSSQSGVVLASSHEPTKFELYLDSLRVYDGISAGPDNCDDGESSTSKEFSFPLREVLQVSFDGFTWTKNTGWGKDCTARYTRLFFTLYGNQNFVNNYVPIVGDGRIDGAVDIGKVFFPPNNLFFNKLRVAVHVGDRRQGTLNSVSIKTRNSVKNFHPTTSKSGTLQISVSDGALYLGTVKDLEEGARWINSSNPNVMVWFSSKAPKDYPSVDWFYGFEPSDVNITDRGSDFRAGGKLVDDKGNVLTDDNVFVYACLDSDLNRVCDFLDDRDFWKNSCENAQLAPGSDNPKTGFVFNDSVTFGLGCCGDDGVIDCNTNVVATNGKRLFCDRIVQPNGDKKWEWVESVNGTVFNSSCFFGNQILLNGSDRLMCGVPDPSKELNSSFDIAVFGMKSQSVSTGPVNFQISFSGPSTETKTYTFSPPKPCTSLILNVKNTGSAQVSPLFNTVSVGFVGGSSGSQTLHAVMRPSTAGDPSSAEYFVDSSGIPVGSFINSVSLTLDSSASWTGVECFNNRAVPVRREVKSVSLEPGKVHNDLLQISSITIPGAESYVLFPLSKNVLLSTNPITKNLDGSVDYVPGNIVSSSQISGGKTVPVYLYVPSSAEAKAIKDKELSRITPFSLKITVPELGDVLLAEYSGSARAIDGVLSKDINTQIGHRITYSLTSPLLTASQDSSSKISKLEFEGKGTSFQHSSGDSIPPIVAELSDITGPLNGIPLTVTGSSASSSSKIRCSALDVTLSWPYTLLSNDRIAHIGYTVVKNSSGQEIARKDYVAPPLYGWNYDHFEIGDAGGMMWRKNLEASNKGFGHGSVVRLEIPSDKRSIVDYFIVENHYLGEVGSTSRYSYNSVAPLSSVVCIPEIPVTLNTKSEFFNGTEIKGAVTRSVDGFIEFPEAVSSFKKSMTPPVPPSLRMLVNTSDVIVGLPNSAMGSDIFITGPVDFNRVLVQTSQDAVASSLAGSDKILDIPETFKNVTISNTGVSHDFVCTSNSVSDSSLSDLRVRECAMLDGGGSLGFSPLSLKSSTKPSDGSLVGMSENEKLYEIPSLTFYKQGTFKSDCSSSGCDPVVKDGFTAPFIQREGLLSLRIVLRDDLESYSRGGTSAPKKWSDFTGNLTFLSYDNGASSAKIWYEKSENPGGVIKCSLNDGTKSSPVIVSKDWNIEDSFTIGFSWGGMDAKCLLNDKVIENSFASKLAPGQLFQFAIPGEKFSIGGALGSTSISNNFRYSFDYYINFYSSRNPEELYCSPVGKWSSELDSLSVNNKFACAEIKKESEFLTSRDFGIGTLVEGNDRKFVWTGSKCCGEWGQMPEFYNDPIRVTSNGLPDKSYFYEGNVNLDAGGCWNSSFVSAGTSELWGRPSSDGKPSLLDGAVMNINGSFVGCDIKDSGILSLNESRAKIQTTAKLVTNYPACTMLNSSLHIAVSSAPSKSYSLCQPGGSGNGVWKSFVIPADPNSPSNPVRGFDGSNPQIVGLVPVMVKLLSGAEVKVLSDSDTSGKISKTSLDGESLFNLSYMVGSDKKYYSSNGCCVKGYCWNGESCIADQTADSSMTLTKDKYRCEKDAGEGVWTEIVPKISPDFGAVGFCPKSEHCFAKNPSGGSIVGNRTSWYESSNSRNNFWCAQSGTFITFQSSNSDTAPKRDAFCNNGLWTSRAVYLSSALYDLVKGSNNFELFCGSVQEVKSVSGSDAATGSLGIDNSCKPVDGDSSKPDNCISNMCVLKRPNLPVIIGAVLNVPINKSTTDNSATFLKSLGSSGNKECDLVISENKDTFAKCSSVGTTSSSKTLFYNPVKQIAIFSTDNSITIPSAPTKRVAQLFSDSSNIFNSSDADIVNALYSTTVYQNVEGSSVSETTIDSSLKPLYFRSDYSKIFLAGNSSNSGQRNVYAMLVEGYPGVPVGGDAMKSLFVVYQNFPSQIRSNLDAYESILGVYNSGNDYYVVASDVDKFPSSGTSWKDLTTKLRIIGGS